MTTNPQAANPVQAESRNYYALPMRGRLFPHEGGAVRVAPTQTSGETAGGTGQKADKKEGFSFASVLDIINPLQHIPIVSSIYRRITGDEINSISRVAGGAMFFGLIGLANSLANAITEKITGKDVGDHVMTAVLGEKDAAPKKDIAPANDTVIVQNEAAPDDAGENNVLAAIPSQNAQRGRVTVHPEGGLAPTPLDAATLDALARTIGSAAPLAHLAPKPELDKTPAKSPSTPPVPAATYNDALIRMQEGMQHYEAAQRGRISQSAK